jgi:hypothetical protein
MNAYVIHYKGSYLGGTGVVLADTADEAKLRLEKLVNPAEWTRVEVRLIGDASQAQVVYNWNGDY